MCYIVTPILIKAGRTGWIRAKAPTDVSPADLHTGGQEEGRFFKPSLGGGEECCSTLALQTADTVVH